MLFLEVEGCKHASMNRWIDGSLWENDEQLCFTTTCILFAMKRQFENFSHGYLKAITLAILHHNRKQKVKYCCTVTKFGFQ
jgi:hypothetical protein